LVSPQSVTHALLPPDKKKKEFLSLILSVQVSTHTPGFVFLGHTSPPVRVKSIRSQGDCSVQRYPWASTTAVDTTIEQQPQGEKKKRSCREKKNIKEGLFFMPNDRCTRGSGWR
jgi:hypothetical protein